MGWWWWWWKLWRRIALAGFVWVVASSLAKESFAFQSTQEAPTATAPQSLPADPRAIYQALNELRPDGTRVYTIHHIAIRRDVVNLTFVEGKLAFLQPLDGHITGAVFTGEGRVFATPRDRGERQSLAQFLGLPMLDVGFSKLILRFTDDTAAEIQEQINAAGARPESDPEFAAEWANVAANLNPWHSLRILSDWLSTDPRPYFYAGVASSAAGAFDVLVDDRRPEQVLIGQPRFSGETRLYDIWASFPAGGTTPNPAGAFAPLDYLVETDIASDLSLDGKTLLHIRALRAGERMVALELSRNLGVETVKTDDGRPLAYFQNEDLSRREILRRGNDSLLVVLPAAAKAGEEFRIEVAYRGSVITDAGNGVAFVGEHGAWYAHTSGEERFVPFDLRFRWPKRVTLVATGTKSEAGEEGDTQFARWKSEVPFAVAGFNLGEYKAETAGAGRPQIEIYANSQLEDAIRERLRKNPAVPVVPSSPSSTITGGKVLPSAATEPQIPHPSDVMKQLGGEIADSIQFFEKLNGSFPFGHLDVSQIPGNFGQGWPELLYLSTLSFLPPETEKQAGIGERAQQTARELLPFHEVAHQWWGNVVVSASYRDSWIEEAMANYLSLLYSDSKKPGAHRLHDWLEHFRDALTTKAPGATLPADEAGPLTFGPRLNSSRTPNAYETVTYGKGAWVIHMLHEMMREPEAKDPDARFREMLQSILTDYHFRPLTTAEFQREVERRMTTSMDLDGNHSMEWFFSEWVRGTGIPHYKVEFQVKARGQEFVVTGKLEQSGVDEAFTAVVPLYGARPPGKRQRLGKVVTTGTETRFHFVTRTRPSRILIDPDLTVLHAE
jgi:Peptidase family M1 domain